MQDYYRIPPFLLQEATVALSPGRGFGEYGERYLRFALIENERRIQEAVKGIKSLFNSAKKQ
jgi:alanine-synthesizing transaminase